MVDKRLTTEPLWACHSNISRLRGIVATWCLQLRSLNKCLPIGTTIQWSVRFCSMAVRRDWYKLMTKGCWSFWIMVAPFAFYTCGAEIAHQLWHFGATFVLLICWHSSPKEGFADLATRRDVRRVGWSDTFLYPHHRSRRKHGTSLWTSRLWLHMM